MSGKAEHRWTWRGLSAWAMLVAALALIVQGATPTFAHLKSVPALEFGVAQHSDCHPGPAAKVKAVHDHDHHITSPETSAHDVVQQPGDERQPMPSRQLDCCTATATVVLPAAMMVPGRETPAESFQLTSVDMPDGLAPEGPSKPPRTSYPG